MTQTQTYTKLKDILGCPQLYDAVWKQCIRI